MLKPARRKALAIRTVKTYSISIRRACALFGISESCYRYTPRLREENTEIADWLIRLTSHQRNWGFGLCFLPHVSIGTTEIYTHVSIIKLKQVHDMTHPTMHRERQRQRWDEPEATEEGLLSTLDAEAEEEKD